MKPVIVYTVKEVTATPTDPAKKIVCYTDTKNKYTAIGEITQSPAAIIAYHIFKEPNIEKLWEAYSDFICIG